MPDPNFGFPSGIFKGSSGRGALSYVLYWPKRLASRFPAGMNRRIVSRALVAALLALPPLVSQSGYEHGKAALKRGEFGTAAQQFAEDARAGHSRAQLALGLLHAAGLGVAQSNAEATTWFARAAEQGNAHAQYNLGLMLLVGIGVARNEREAVRWFREAARMGLPQAQSDLGALHFYGRHGEIAYPEALSWLRAAAERGHPLAQVNLASAYLTGGAASRPGFEGAPFSRPPGVTGDLIPKDERKAARWFQMAAAQGVVVAQFNLGLLHEKGLGVEPNQSEAMKWYARAVDAEFVPAFVNLARLYESGPEVARDRAAAIQLRIRSWQSGLHRTQQHPIVVMHFGIRTLRHLDGRKIWADRRQIGTDDPRGGTLFFLFEPDFLIDPDLGFDLPHAFRPVGLGPQPR